jgi:hypothetical protein
MVRRRYLALAEATILSSTVGTVSPWGSRAGEHPPHLLARPPRGVLWLRQSPEALRRPARVAGHERSRRLDLALFPG